MGRFRTFIALVGNRSKAILTERFAEAKIWRSCEIGAIETKNDGHGSKFDRNKESLIATLISQKNAANTETRRPWLAPIIYQPSDEIYELRDIVRDIPLICKFRSMMFACF